MADTQTPEKTYDPITLSRPVGESRVRTSGRAKVVGGATFSAEWPVPNLLHVVAVPSTIARGKVTLLDTSAAEAMDGVRLVLTPDNAPKVNSVPNFGGADAGGSNRAESTIPIHEQEVHFAGQYLAAVIAETFEAARDAALAVRIEYERTAHTTDFAEAEPSERPSQLMGAPPVMESGSPESSLADAERTYDKRFHTAMNHHNPIEPHAAIAVWNDDAADDEPTLTLYDTVQSIPMEAMTAARMFGLKPSQVRAVNKYIGGAFGAKGGMWPHAVLAIMASKATGQPVCCAATRRQMYGGTGHRTPTSQRIALGADADGQLHTIIHEGHAATAKKEKKSPYSEAFTMATRMMYAGQNRRVAQKQSRTDTQQPTFMRAPAETPGLYALEAAVNEFAHDLGIDPVQFRIKNDPDRDPLEDKPFSNRQLVGCLRAGAAKFGWSDRPAQPRATRDGDWLIGTGVAAATYPAFHFPTKARVVLQADGRVRIECATHEMGTGTRTVQEQLAADLLGISPSRVTLELGDSTLPPGGVSGGSATTSSVGGAIRLAVESLREELQGIAPKGTPIANAKLDSLSFSQGRLAVDGEGVPFEDLLSAAMRNEVAATGAFSPKNASPEKGGYSSHSFGATFVEVGVDEPLGLVRVRRMLGCYACGTILNRRTARSQFLGGMVMGIGHALMEETKWDHRFGRVTNDNLAEYHVPVNADVPDLDVMWINDPDFNASPIGAKGIGEIGITGVAAAITEAVWHATGKRHYQTPILPSAVVG